MSIHIATNHLTEYRYDRLVSLSPHVVRLRPAPHCRTPIESYSMKVEPAGHFINWQQDPYGNYLARLVFPERTRRLSIEVDLRADMTVINPFDFFLEESAELYPFEYEPSLARDLAPYLAITERGPELLAWLAEVDRRPQTPIDFLVGLNQRIQRDVRYVVRMESGVQTCEQTLSSAWGSCRDSGWLLVQCLRHLGLAARFVSGYLVQLAPDMKPVDGPAGPTEDFTDLHAWAEVYLPGAGWVGLDATSGLLAGEGHIPLACTPAPSAAAPVTGDVSKAKTEFSFHNRVTRVHEDARVTRPYSDEQWEAVLALGDAVDAELVDQDVRLTMGGEPTFVSIDDMEGDEWNTAALGEDKRERAEALLQGMRERFASNAVIQRSQGKWYPGEPLPRWSLACYWRTDGEALWRDAALHAEFGRDYGHDEARARTLAEGVVAQLGLARDFLCPAFEDAEAYAAAQRALPENVDSNDNRLEDPLERARMARLAKQSLDTPVGYVLPLAPPEKEGGPWRSAHWQPHLRGGQMALLPGDSPMGLRLPLASLPWVAPKDIEPVIQVDSFEVRAALHPSPDTAKAEGVDESQPARIPHTALCVEAREGCVHVFMPPLDDVEHAVELLAVLERAAAAAKVPFVLEGYALPEDSRIKSFRITPDPGVIEVNVHPAASWRELVDMTTALYALARKNRLGADKFMVDGRHTGTGGGNHVTLGAARPEDSPALRRPDLLRSLITYWQHHPCLSYLFSGTFIGPTSQAPRVDEARHESLYELEIAFDELAHLQREATAAAGDATSGSQVAREDAHIAAVSPWLVDRALRHLLVDITGNTHRAEFCIDKLYSPDGPTGRLGLVELRAFEMPPHERLSVVQMLLLRALVAWFWREPYARPLVRWGTALHDRFLLPHFVRQDLEDVVGDLRGAGYGMDRAWFDAFWEFRFPRYGAIEHRGIEVELRGAIEPWHVLGEEVTAQSTARFVDASVERLQVCVRGLAGQRYAVACNGRRLPLHPTGFAGEYVAGVRYKAWQPPSGLHPMIPVHAPLTFDLVDLRNRLAVAGCTYHVVHPGGRNYETFPVNANEAEARRVARFESIGHTSGEVALEGESINPEYPLTLDLRYGRHGVSKV